MSFFGFLLIGLAAALPLAMLGDHIMAALRGEA